MKRPLLLIIFSISLLPLFAQKEVVIRNRKSAFITRVPSPLSEISVDIESDYKSYFSTMEVKDSTMVFRSNQEYAAYIVKLQKALKANENLKRKPVSMPDASLYIVKNRELLRPGQEIEIFFEEYRISQRNIARYLVIQTKLEGRDSFEGVFEGLVDSVAIIDGKSVVLRKGALIEGTQGFTGQKFNSFNELMIGSFVSVTGVRQSSGILLVDKGKTWENQETQQDLELKQTLRSTMKLTSDAVSFGDEKFRLLKNQDLLHYVTAVGQAVVPQYQKELPSNHPVKIDFSFHVVEDSTFNACAYPDGSIFIHTALLVQLENEAQLAVILGHEIAHVTYEHSRAQLRNKQNINAMFNIFSINANVSDKDLYILANGMGGPALSSAYDRKLEEQADRAGLNYMYQAGYDPREASRLWKKMYQITDIPDQYFGANLERALEKGINSLYASHPNAWQRYKNVNRLIALNYQNEDLTSLKVNKVKYLGEMKLLQKWLQVITHSEVDTIELPNSPAVQQEQPQRWRSSGIDQKIESKKKKSRGLLPKK